MIPHFIICFGHWKEYVGYDVKTSKDIFLSKMRRYGIRSATLTKLHFWRHNLQSKEAVIQKHRMARQDQLEMDNGNNVTVQRILSEDLESFYTNFQNQEPQLKKENASIFTTQKLTEEELKLLKDRDKDYLNKFNWYRESGGPFSIFDEDMKEIGKSSDPESIFSQSCGHRYTIALHVTGLLAKCLTFFNAWKQSVQDRIQPRQ